MKPGYLEGFVRDERSREVWDAGRPVLMKATLTAGPRGSMGEEVEPPIVLLGSDPGDRCHDAVELYGFVQDGIVTVTGERQFPYRVDHTLPHVHPRDPGEPFVIHVEPDYQADLLRQLMGKADAIAQEACEYPYGFPVHAVGAAEFNAMQDVYRDLFDTGTGAFRLSLSEEADRLEIERINMTGARYRESVRLTPHGSEPWDQAAGECS